MEPAEAELMARPKAKPKGSPQGSPAPTPRTTIINLKGSDEQADWLEAIHRKTYLSKSVIVRLALTLWAEKNGHQAFPSSEED